MNITQEHLTLLQNDFFNANINSSIYYDNSSATAITFFDNPLTANEMDYFNNSINSLNKFIQTNNQSINLSKGLDSFRELFNQKELKTFKIKNHSQVSEYINKFELVFNYTCSQSIDPSILHNIMLQCKLHGTTDKVINSIRTKPKV